MKKSAFSMLELSFSLIIIGILMGIVAQGIKIISSSKLAAARSLTESSPVKSIPGLIAWYETTSADSLKTSEASDGRQISTWYDISPDSIPARKNTLTRTASAAVTYVAKGTGDIPSIKFNGTGKLSIVDFYQGSSAQSTFFIVFKPNVIPSGSANILIDSGHPSVDGSNVAAFGLVTSSSMQFHFGSNGASGAIPSTSPAVLSVGQNYILAFNANWTNSRAYINDATTAINSGAVFNPGAHVVQGITVGTDRNGAYTFNGQISEVIVFNRVLTAQERKDVMNYLGKKYEIKVTGL